MTFESVYSRIDSTKLLHALASAFQEGNARVDLSPPSEFLQASIVPLGEGRRVAPHIHSPRDTAAPGPSVTQESWLVLRGRIRVELFDLDQSPLVQREMSAGQLLVTFYGGHALECIEPGTIVLEFKTGPYLGRDFVSFSGR